MYIPCKFSMYSVWIQCKFSANTVHIQWKYSSYTANTAGCAESWCELAAAGADGKFKFTCKMSFCRTTAARQKLPLVGKIQDTQLDSVQTWAWTDQRGKAQQPPASFSCKYQSVGQTDWAKYFAALHRGRISLLRQPDSLLDGCTGFAGKLYCCCC